LQFELEQHLTLLKQSDFEQAQSHAKCFITANIRTWPEKERSLRNDMVSFCLQVQGSLLFQKILRNTHFLYKLYKNIGLTILQAPSGGLKNQN